jgi:hypothetical protein
MNAVWIRKIIFSLSLLIIMIILFSCYKFEFIDQPEFADPNSPFDVSISIKLTPEVEGGRAFFGICLPIGWTVRDSISYTGVLNGTFLYSRAKSDSMEKYWGSPEGRYWWVSVSDSVDALPEGKISLTPQIRTDDQTGVFFIDYMLTDRFDDDRMYEAVELSDDHPVSVGVFPTVETVTNTNDNGEGSLREITSNVGPGSTILFDLSYPATMVLDSQLIIDRSLTIVGPEYGELTISGNNNDRVIEIKRPRSVSLSNLNIINGNTEGYGGGIFCESPDLYLSNINVCDNKANDAGGIFINGTKARLENVTLSNNISIYEEGGGIFVESHGDLILVNSILWGNSPKEIWGEPNSVIVAYSDIQYGQQGLEFSTEVVNWLEGNIGKYPKFVNVSSKDYRLLEGSPCIDAAIQDTFLVYNDNLDTLFIPAMDYLGQAPDIGANEFDPTTTIKKVLDMPRVFFLSQNYPNPFNPATVIEFQIPNSEFVILEIFNSLGERVSTLLSASLHSGSYKYEWNAVELASGVYYYQLKAGEFEDVKKMILKRCLPAGQRSRKSGRRGAAARNATKNEKLY